MLAARARYSALESFPVQWKPTASARRSFPSVQGCTPTCQPRPQTSSFLARVRKKKRHFARSLSQEQAHHALLRRARAVSHWLGSIHALWKPTVPARRPSLSVQGHAPTCQPRPPSSSFLAHVRKKKRHRARSLCREDAHHAR